MRIKVPRRFLPLVIVGVLLLAMVPAVSAYEGHLVNITAHVKGRFDFIKCMRLANDGEIADAINPGIEPVIVFPGDPNPPTVTDPARVPVETCVVWMVTIAINNNHDYPMQDVVVTDHFGAELAVAVWDVEPLSSWDVVVDPKTHTRPDGTTFETQYRVTWYVGTLLPGEGATLDLLVWTKLNPAGKQEYTSPGDYTLNSGPTMKWRDPEGHQSSSTAPSLEVEAYVP